MHFYDKFHSKFVNNPKFCLYTSYRVSQNSRIPNSERSREGPVELEKYLLRKKKSLFMKKIYLSTLILFNTWQPSYPQ
jgi:hypothetical protein